MNLYIENKTTRKSVAFVIGFSAWLLLMLSLGHFAVFCMEYLGMAGFIPPIVIALYIYHLIEKKNSKNRSIKIAKKRRDQINIIRQNNYKEAGILSQYEPL